MSSTNDPRTQRSMPAVVRLMSVFVVLYLFLLGVNGLGEGFKLLGRDVLDTFFAATSNPFVGLVVGVLATTLVQSSSATTSMIVGLVAAPENPLPLANAIPMVMGANIGTTVTNTIVSLAHMGRPEEFRRAFATATCHDFFNFSTVLLLLPLEMATGFLGKSAAALDSIFQGAGAGGMQFESPLKGILKAGLVPFQKLAQLLFSGSRWEAIFLILVSGLLIFFALYALVKLLRTLVQSRVEKALSAALDSSAVFAMLLGVIVTVMVQSSSITTSLLVPLAGAGIITLEQAFPVTLGANVGTTVTGFLAALAVSGPNASVGLQIATVHLLFNVTGTLIIYPVAVVRRLPLIAARWLADAAVKSRKLALAYVVGLFYVIPGLLVLLDKLLFYR